jgi:Transposase IS66 family
LLQEKPKVLPKSPMGVAIDYTLSNWQALLRYTEDSDLQIDNKSAVFAPSWWAGATGFFTEVTKAGELEPC